MNGVTVDVKRESAPLQSPMYARPLTPPGRANASSLPAMSARLKSSAPGKYLPLESKLPFAVKCHAVLGPLPGDCVGLGGSGGVGVGASVGVRAGGGVEVGVGVRVVGIGVRVGVWVEVGVGGWEGQRRECGLQ